MRLGEATPPHLTKIPMHTSLKLVDDSAPAGSVCSIRVWNVCKARVAHMTTRMDPTRISGRDWTMYLRKERKGGGREHSKAEHAGVMQEKAWCASMRI
jgi:hypothetical protein